MGELVGAELFGLLEGDLAWEDEAVGEEDECGAFDLARHPLPHAEHEVFVDQDPNSVRQLVFRLPLVPSVPEVDYRVHTNSNIIQQHY